MAVTKQYEKKDGTKAWLFQAYLGVDPLTGKEKRTTRRGFKTEKEANLALARLQLDVDKNGFRVNYNINTFQDLYEDWIEQYQHTIKPTTYERVVALFANHILPKLGTLKLEKIKHVAFQKLINKWAGDFKTKSVRNLRTYAKMVFNQGIRIEVCDSNPFDKVVIPKDQKEPIPAKKEAFYTKEELKYFFECLQQVEKPIWITFFRLLAFTGGRKGEILALTWDDIDFVSGTININKTLVRIKGKHGIQSPKTNTSNRVIGIDLETLAILKKWKIEQQKEKLMLGIREASGSELVFNGVCSTGESKYIYLYRPNYRLGSLYRKFPSLKQITIHGFRHTHASLMFESGADIKVVQKRLGHSNIQVTMDIYTHVSPNHEKNTGERFAKYVNF
ncbi:tyrosine-type recombinase/integrase [Peribacillus sp. NPDC006672]|uniref:site-specific integrase n=1 Tax=Peribacillus sp. NPDC006672 TaxID=3390606 RepID=UPI003D00576A